MRRRRRRKGASSVRVVEAFGPFSVKVNKEVRVPGLSGGGVCGGNIVAAFHGGVDAGFLFEFALGAV